MLSPALTLVLVLAGPVAADLDAFVEDARRYAAASPGEERLALGRDLRERHAGLSLAELREGLRRAFPPTEGRPEGRGPFPRAAPRPAGPGPGPGPVPGFPYADYPYAVRLPEGYDPARNWPVLFWIQARGTDDSGWSVWDERLPDHILVAPRMRADDPDWPGSPTFETAHAYLEAILPDLFAAYAVDTDRVHLGGFSFGGSIAWSYATFLADRAASVIAGAGYAVEDVRLMVGCRGVPIWSTYGGKDTTLPLDLALKPIHRLEELGYEHVWDHDPKRGHELPAASMDRLAEWLRGRVRRGDPRSLSQATSPKVNPWGRHWWLRLTRWKNLVELGAEVAEDNALHLRLGGLEGYHPPSVQGLEVCLSDAWVDYAKPVTVTINGLVVHSAVVRPDPGLALDLYLERRDPALVYNARVVLEGEVELAR